MAKPFSKRALRFSSVYLLAFALAFSAITVPRDLTTSTDFFILEGNVSRPGWKINIFLKVSPKLQTASKAVTISLWRLSFQTGCAPTNAIGSQLPGQPYFVDLMLSIHIP
jgi:hypothetical protein